MPRPFLTASWTNLFLATYPVPPALLRHRLPPGLELDTRGGQAFVSLVAFDFLNTRVVGIPWPGYRDFAELNLRFYVRTITGERGVVFIREFVPQRLTAWLARLIYNEPYVAAPLESNVRDEPDRVVTERRLLFGGRTHTIAATGRKPGHVPPEESDEHFFKEHQWGFGVTRGGKPLRYEVCHPAWKVFPVESYHLDLDWGMVYGSEWAFLGSATPCSTVLAGGSAIAVYPKGRLVPAAVPALQGTA